jgi:hypothetical protein
MKKIIICGLFIGLFACSKKEEVKPIEKKYIPKDIPSKIPIYYLENDSTITNK